MDVELAAFTFDFIGKILIAITAVMVHTRIRKEKRIDKRVLKEMRWEEMLGILGIVFMTIGYFLHLRVIG
ncbi:MAG: hypothetical protein KC506_00180 [Nanoarchaeota archaeon]|nr:hypothetical protein [Nanoarchaeota archaeon]